MLANVRWIGWAYAEEWGIVVRFESDYKTRESVRANVDRCASAYLNATVFVTECHIYGPDCNELCSEDAEAAALDLPSGWMGENGHAVLIDIDVTAQDRTAANAVKAYALGVGMRHGIASDLMDAYATVTDAQDEGEAAEGFISFLATMRRRAGLAA